MQLSLTRPLWPLSPKLSQGDELQNFIFMHAWPIVAALAVVALAVALLVARRRLQSSQAMR